MQSVRVSHERERVVCGWLDSDFVFAVCTCLNTQQKVSELSKLIYSRLNEAKTASVSAQSFQLPRLPAEKLLSAVTSVIGVAVNPDSELIPVARAGGITTILALPTGGTIAGQASAVKLGG